MRPFILVLTFILSLVLAGCASAPAAEPTPTPTPRELSAAIGRATQASQSVRFLIELAGRPVAIDANGFTVLTRMEGDLRRPDAVLAILNVTLGSAIAELRTVSFEGRQYLTNPLTRQWQCLPPDASFDPVVLFAPDRGIEFLLQERFADVSQLSNEVLNEREQVRLRGTMAGEDLQAISLNLLGAGPVAVDLWADAQTLRLTRMVLVDLVTDTADPSIWTLNFRDYDKTVEVRAPVECP
ncbi:MAG: LppX_LprAFG lipoprotein [Oscillochloridaceae bacterium umkhey_bin13]